MVRYVVGLDALPMVELRSPADGVQCFAARQPLSVAGDTKVLCVTNRAVCPGPDSIPKFSWRKCAQTGTIRPKNVARRPGRYHPCRRLGRERSRHANPKPPVGPLTSARDRIRPLVRASIVLISPCGSGVLHRMGQRPAVLRHSQRIASIEPPLAARTPAKAIGVERSV